MAETRRKVGRRYRRYPIKLAELARRMGLSRQRVWQLQRKGEGKCAQCGEERDGLASLCRRCAKLKREGKRVGDAED